MNSFNAKSGALLASLVVAAAATVGAQHPRHFQSRAAFAALDSSALTDSSAMRPLDRTRDPDAALLDMTAYLDSTIGRFFGVGNTRVRWWRDFGTQAHPRLGVLVDDAEFDNLRSQLVRQKGSAGVPLPVANQRVVHALRFLVAHEYGHLLQYHGLARDTIELPQMTRAVECSADLLGAMSVGRYLEGDSRSDSASAEAIGTVEHFGYLVGSPDWLDMSAHPTPTERRECIVAGLRNSALLEFATSDRVPADSAGRAFAERVRREAPDVYARRITIVQWSFQKARQLVGLTWSRSNAMASDLSVTRDTSVSTAVARLVNLALRGPSAMEALRGPRSPGGESASVLLESLPVPWKCSLERVDNASAGLCRYDDHGETNEALRIFDGTEDDIRLGLFNVDFQTETKVRTRVGTVAPGDSLITATRFLVHGRGELQAKRGEIVVTLIRPSWKQMLMVQQSPPFRVTVSISPAR